MGDNNVERLLSVFRDAMELERRGHAFYLKAAEMTANARGKRTFLTLASDELQHLNYLDKAFRSVLQTGALPKMAEPLEAISSGEKPKRPEVFVSPKEVAEEVKAQAGELDALKRGIQAEEDSIALYSQAYRDAASPEEERLFGALVTWEQGHRTILAAEYDHITGTGFWFGFQEFDLENAG